MYIYLLIGFFYLFVSCNNENENTYTILYKKPNVIIDSLLMQMPGSIFNIKNNIIIEDALAINNFYNLYDSSGSFIRNIAAVGNSSIEFVTPTLTLLANNDVVISDMNRGNAIIYKNDTDTIYPYKSISPELLRKVPLVNINNNVFITINNFFKGDNEGELFNLYDNNILIKSFGKFPILEKINNRHDIYQGFLGYNNQNKTLVFFSYKIPYYAIYKNVHGNDFKLIKEDKYAKFNYLVNNNNNLIIKGFEKKIIRSEVALLKNYIVTLGNTEEDIKSIPAENGRDRDFNQLPRSLFIHDYDYNLLKVISLQTSIVRITSCLDSNILHLINYVNGEFKLSKVDVE